MQRSSLKLAIFSLMFVLGVALLGAPVAQAAGPAQTVYQDAGEDAFDVTGTITAIDEDAGTIEIETGDGSLFVIVAPEGFDFETVQVGDTIEAAGFETEDGDLAADRSRSMRRMRKKTKTSRTMKMKTSTMKTHHRTSSASPTAWHTPSPAGLPGLTTSSTSRS